MPLGQASRLLLCSDLESELVSYPETEVPRHPNNERPLVDEYFELGILLQSLVKLSGESCESCRTNKKSRKLRRKRRTRRRKLVSSQAFFLVLVVKIRFSFSIF